MQMTSINRWAVIAFGILPLLFSVDASAVLTPTAVHPADGQKKNAFVTDGLITGGDRSITDVVIKDIRRGPNAGFERIVIELEGNLNGNPAPISRPPYYQVAVSPEERRLVVTIWGSPKLQFPPSRIHAAFKKSALVNNVELLPKIEDDLWTFVLNLREGKSVEVFELTNPARVIVDIQKN
ncbi:MAG: hypothetical protein AAB425_09025 [Bdellovibrionota bacterium]